MIKSVRVKFDKYLHSTGKAILVKVGKNEHWIPVKLCRDLIVNKKLGGNVCVPTFIAERMGIDIDDCQTDVEIIHHVPAKVEAKEVQPDNNLIKKQ